MRVIAPPSRRLAAFQALADQINAMGISPMERRGLLERAGAETGVTSCPLREGFPAQSGKLIGLNDNAINHAKNPSRTRKRGAERMPS